MISNLSPANQAFLANMDRLQLSMQSASMQASTGKRVNVASDAPNDISTILQLRTAEGQNAQIQQNLAVAQADASAADGALSSATQMMDRATTLAAQGANFTATAAGRQSMAAEIQSIQDQMVNVSGTSVQGRYIFGGDQGSSPPYASNPAGAYGVTQLTNSVGTRQVENSAGGSFAVSQNAQQIFDTQNADGTPAADNVFAALNNLRLGLLANDTAQITAAGSSIQLASTHLNTAQAFYGTVENRITDATNYSSNYDVRLQTELSQKQDADIPAAALAVTQGTTEIQAAFQMQAKMPHSSLFEFMG
jgi:flagellar hook-associated protein 3 FlgL